MTNMCSRIESIRRVAEEVRTHFEGVERFMALTHACEKRVDVCVQNFGVNERTNSHGCYLHFIDFNLE